MRVLTWRDGDLRLLLPAAAVAEVARLEVCPPPSPHVHWLRGTYGWRGLRLPLVSLAAAPGPPAANAPLLICATPADEAPEALVLLATSLPVLQDLDLASAAAAEPEVFAPLLLTSLRLEDAVYAVPDLGLLAAEAARHGVWGGADTAD